MPKQDAHVTDSLAETAWRVRCVSLRGSSAARNEIASLFLCHCSMRVVWAFGASPSKRDGVRADVTGSGLAVGR
jgi:hypothetical protein